MILKNRLKPFTALALTVLGVSTLAAGCSAAKNLQDAACCSDFKVGTDMTNANFGVDASIQGQFLAYAQATGDLSATASATLADVTTACQNIALDLGGDATDSRVTGKVGVDLTKGWCAIAADQIKATFGGGKGSLAASISVGFQAPKCTASVTATANCEGSCDVKAMCDVKVHPPTCDGGTLNVDCKGDCTAKAGATLSCTGSCQGSCTGSCKASGGAKIDCKGKCDGTCTAGATGGATAKGTGIQADGSCDGQCDGTCTLAADAPKINCTGVCDGQCSGTCKGTADASVKCDGECKADYTPISCNGGTFKAGCDVDANCQASCNASASAKASCTPPSLSIDAKANADADATAYAAAVNTLKVNLPALVLALKVRGAEFVTNAQAAGTAGVNVVGSGSLSAKATVCVADVGIAIGDAVDNMQGAIDASTKVDAVVKFGS